VAYSNDVCLEVWRDGKASRVIASNALRDGETANWKVGVDTSGLMWIEKNGICLAQILGFVPSNIIRYKKLLGSSNWDGDAPLKGAVLGIDIVNIGDTSDGGFLNNPEQITGPFQIHVMARFNELSEGAWQRIFDFGNGPQNDCIFLGQCGSSTDMCFQVWKNGIAYSLQAAQVLKVNEMANWSVGVDATGFMWITKNGKRVAEGQGAVPANVKRNKSFIGESNWPLDKKLKGIVAGLKVLK
jgi:hypothetical protein